MHPQYQEWISYVFDHPGDSCEWDSMDEFPGTPTDHAILIHETFSRSGTDLQCFTDAQVNQGLYFLVSPTGSNHMLAFRDENVPLPIKIQGIQSIATLYRECFAKRCTEVLGHLDEKGASDLNAICYMFWDVCVLSYLDPCPNHKQDMEDAVLSVLRDTIHIPHRACIEGGLHGLGEICFGEDRANEILEELLATKNLDPDLKRYAENARDEYVL